ncbi:MAG: type 1 pili tip component [Pseudomonadota bacterium]
MSFKALLERWRDTPVTVTTESAYAIRLDVDDAARVEALAALFPGIDAETVIADLLHAALDATEAAMPYEAGERVIAEDEFGDAIFEDVGLTPRYVELVRARRDDLN